MRTTFFALSFTLLLSAGITMHAVAATPCLHKAELISKEPDSLAADNKKQCAQQGETQEMRSPQARAELMASAPVHKPAAVQQKKEEPTRQQSFSAFSFLYYLFYKFNPQDIITTPGQSVETEINTPTAW